MGFLKDVFESIGELGSIGDQARAAAREADVDTYYIDRRWTDAILVEHPDGLIELEADALRHRRKLAGT